VDKSTNHSATQLSTSFTYAHWTPEVDWIALWSLLVFRFTYASNQSGAKPLFSLTSKWVTSVRNVQNVQDCRCGSLQNSVPSNQSISQSVS